MTKIRYNEWSLANQKALKYVHTVLIQISKLYGIELIHDDKTYQLYLKMMYNESSKIALDPELYE